MPEKYSLSGSCRQNGRIQSLSGEVVIYQTGRIAGKLFYEVAPEPSSTIEGKARREGLQAELGLLASVPGDKQINVFYRVRGTPNDSFAGIYQGSYVPVEKELGMRVVGCPSVTVQEVAFGGAKPQYAQIMLKQVKEKKRKRKK